MRRREFITLLGFGRGRSSTTPEAWAINVAAFRQGLEATGYVEGRNVLIEYRWAEDHYERLPTLAADLVSRQVIGHTQDARDRRDVADEIELEIRVERRVHCSG